MNDIGIYVRGISTEEVLQWLHSIVNNLTLVDKDESIYHAGMSNKNVSIQIQQNIENQNICEIYFNPNNTKWINNEACAREAHKALGKSVFCSPEGDNYSPSQFLEFSSTGENIIEI